MCSFQYLQQKASIEKIDIAKFLKYGEACAYLIPDNNFAGPLEYQWNYGTIPVELLFKYNSCHEQLHSIITQKSNNMMLLFKSPPIFLSIDPILGM